jgi:hypothetical protein
VKSESHHLRIWEAKKLNTHDQMEYTEYSKLQNFNEVEEALHALKLHFVARKLTSFVPEELLDSEIDTVTVTTNEAVVKKSAWKKIKEALKKPFKAVQQSFHRLPKETPETPRIPQPESVKAKLASPKEKIKDTASLVSRLLHRMSLKIVPLDIIEDIALNSAHFSYEFGIPSVLVY